MAQLSAPIFDRGDASPGAAREYVALDAFARTTVSVDASPLATAGMLAFDAIQPHAHLGTPAALRRAIRSQLRRRDLDVLAAFARTTVPDQLTGSAIAPPSGFAQIICGDPSAGTRLEDGLEQIAATPAEEFAEVSACCAPQMASESWSLLSSNPRRWLERYAVTLRRAWREIEPLWQRSSGLIEREVERIAAGSDRGVSANVMTALHPRSLIVDGTWALPPTAAGKSRPTRYALADRVIVCPMLTGPRGTALFKDGAGRVAAMFYPLPGASGVLHRTTLPPAPSLEALIGPQRTAILRRLDAPAAAGAIAEALYLAPSGATHHLRNLEAAGLIRRIRVGRRVMVERTARGTALLTLYE